MSSNADAAIDLERFELRLFPNDPPPSCDLQAAESALQYDLSAPAPNPAIVRVVERFGLPDRPLVATRLEGGEEEEEYQVLRGGSWIRAAREAGLEQIPVRAIELPDVQAAFLALVLNQPQAGDVAAQADALQALLEAGTHEEDLARASGLGRGRLRRLRSLLDLHPVLRQALREGCLRPQIAFAAAQLSEATQDALAERYLQEGELSGADMRRAGGGVSEPGGLAEPGGGGPGDAEPGGADILTPEPAPAAGPGESEAAHAGPPAPPLEDGATPPDAVRARRQAEELLRTLERAGAAADLRRRVMEVIEELRDAAP